MITPPPFFNVTFFNPLSGERGMVIDAVTKEQADAVIVRFGNPEDKFNFLADLRKEPCSPTTTPD